MRFISPGKLVGRVACYDTPGIDANGVINIIKPHAFTDALKSGENVLALVGHNQECFLGSVYNGTLKLTEDPEGVLAEITLPNNALGRAIALAVFYRRLTGMSFYGQSMQFTSNEAGTLRTIYAIDRLVDVGPARPPAFKATTCRWAPTFGDGRRR
jgi:HK97 family phage prohead protease